MSYAKFLFVCVYEKKYVQLVFGDPCYEYRASLPDTERISAKVV